MLKHKNEQEQVEYFIINLDGTEAVFQEPYNPMHFEAVDGDFYGACIKCIQPRCLRYYDNEYACCKVPDFSIDADDSVCPVDAIGWSNEKQEIVIDGEKCIGCGICISRCPYGAIFINNQGDVKINTERPNYRYEVIDFSSDANDRQAECAVEVESITTNRQITATLDSSVERVYKEIRKQRAFAPLLCRNLIISLGYNCSIRRTGDVYTRTDAIFEADDLFGVIEIELDNDSLSAARNLLDDLAVIQSRYGVNSRSSIPVALCLVMPNKRQGYFQVCDDVEKVLEIRIRTLTIGALLVLMWSGAKLGFSQDNFRLGFRNTSIKSDLQKILGAGPIIARDTQGVLESIK